MNVAIIEDEKLAADHLEMLLKRLIADVNIDARLTSVKDSIIYLLKDPKIDFIFMDIQLSDGLSFEIIDSVKIKVPIIFTTAYDEYAIKAFRANSIAYLLKPIDKDDLAGVIQKIDTLGLGESSVQNVSDSLQTGYKERFLLKVGEHIRSVPSESISRFYSRDKVNFLINEENRHLPLDMTIDQLEQKLDPKAFFRINRSNIIRLDSIADIVSYTNSRLRVVLSDQDPSGEDLIVARERVGAFKQWLDR